LPPVITAAEQVFDFTMPRFEPNFVTQREVRARVVSHTDTDFLAGSIVAIPSADPGYDWLFAHGIAGLITAYGGANSHMAIRAGELSLPAVIGAGERLYRNWSSSSRLHIDCANRRVEVLQ
jgi:phosphohistidine swiveling domain-containing protein